MDVDLGLAWGCDRVGFVAAGGGWAVWCAVGVEDLHGDGVGRVGVGDVHVGDGVEVLGLHVGGVGLQGAVLVVEGGLGVGCDVGGGGCRVVEVGGVDVLADLPVVEERVLLGDVEGDEPAAVALSGCGLVCGVGVACGELLERV